MPIFLDFFLFIFENVAFSLFSLLQSKWPSSFDLLARQDRENLVQWDRMLCPDIEWPWGRRFRLCFFLQRGYRRYSKQGQYLHHLEVTRMVSGHCLALTRSPLHFLHIIFFCPLKKQPTDSSVWSRNFVY